MAARKFPKRLFATINVGKTPVRFQLDSGASCNVNSAKTLENCLSDYDEIKTVELNPVDEINAVAARKFPKRLFATINVGKTPVRFQLDSGASCNFISAKTLENCLGEVELKKTTKRLSMYNRTTVQPLGLCQLELYNTKNGNVYQVEFTVLRQDCTTLLWSETTQEMDLIQVRF